MSSTEDAMTSFLQSTLQKPVHVILSTGSQFIGTLCTIDALFNLVLRNAVEMTNGHEVAKYQSIFIRGNRVIHVATAE